MDLLKLKIEKVYPNSYFQNLLLDLPRSLRRFRQVVQVRLMRPQPLHRDVIGDWEKIHSVSLPKDLKNFFIAHNGFAFEWSYRAVPSAVLVPCGIFINTLDDLLPLSEIENYYHGIQSENRPAGIYNESGHRRLVLSENSKVFKLASIDQECTVCVVYFNIWLAPTIWLYTVEEGFFFLANFSTYIRMCIAHLGISGWQYLFSPLQPPKWTLHIMRKLTPHLLRRAEGDRICPTADGNKKTFTNTLEPSVFQNCWRPLRQIVSNAVALVTATNLHQHSHPALIMNHKKSIARKSEVGRGATTKEKSSRRSSIARSQVSISPRRGGSIVKRRRK